LRSKWRRGHNVVCKEWHNHQAHSRGCGHRRQSRLSAGKTGTRISLPPWGRWHLRSKWRRGHNVVCREWHNHQAHSRGCGHRRQSRLSAGKRVRGISLPPWGRWHLRSKWRRGHNVVCKEWHNHQTHSRGHGHRRQSRLSATKRDAGLASPPLGKVAFAPQMPERAQCRL